MKRTYPIDKLDIDYSMDLVSSEAEDFSELPNKERCAILKVQAKEIKRLKEKIRRVKHTHKAHFLKSQRKESIFENTMLDQTLISLASVNLMSKENDYKSEFVALGEVLLGLDYIEVFCGQLLDSRVNDEVKQSLINNYLLRQTQLIKQLNFLQFSRMKEIINFRANDD